MHSLCRLRQTIAGSELESRGLGAIAGTDARAGLAVQDWKLLGNRLFASGLFRGPGVAPESPKSRFVFFTDFSEPKFQETSVSLPKQNGIELAREAMAISEGVVYFLPEDLGASNRMFRIPLADISKTKDSRSSLGR